MPESVLRKRIVATTKANGWADWTEVFSGTELNAFGEVDVDASRLGADGVISAMYQQNSTETTPSPIRVADFRLDSPILHGTRVHVSCVP